MRASEWLDKLDQGAIPTRNRPTIFASRLEPCLRKILGEYSGQTVAVSLPRRGYSHAAVGSAGSADPQNGGI